MASNPKIVIVGVGNSGTKFLGTAIQSALTRHLGLSTYHYEPLYWSGKDGENGIVLDRAAISQHQDFPLVPEGGDSWPWLVEFLDNLNGLAKFIRLGSRVPLVLRREDVKVVWLVRDLWCYLASMQKNFPRCQGRGGWHHSPGEYDDFRRLQLLFPEIGSKDCMESRLRAEAAWWWLHNQVCFFARSHPNLFCVQYEGLCANPERVSHELSNFLGMEVKPPEVRLPPERALLIAPAEINWISSNFGSLNQEINQFFQNA